MVTKKGTISVRLDDRAKQRVEKAARVLRQSSGAFLEKAGEERARQVLLEWALERRQQTQASFSELAEETGLALEEIMEFAGKQGRAQAVEMFLAGCRTVAEMQDNPAFLRLAEEAVKAMSSQ